MESVTWLAQEEVSVDGRHRHRGSHIGRDKIVRHFVPDKGRAKRGERLDIDPFPPLDAKTSRCVHPGVSERDEKRGRDSARRDHPTGEDVSPLAYLVPAIEVDAQKDRLGEKS